ncbi:hypothetical protein GCM10020229_76810 [Kitasatospora albolonga]
MRRRRLYAVLIAAVLLLAGAAAAYSAFARERHTSGARPAGIHWVTDTHAQPGPPNH